MRLLLSLSFRAACAAPLKICRFGRRFAKTALPAKPVPGGTSRRVPARIPERGIRGTKKHIVDEDVRALSLRRREKSAGAPHSPARRAEKTRYRKEEIHEQ